MMEPVGFTASIITLVDLAKEVIEYLRDAYHGKKERNEIFVEVTSTQDVLLQVQEKENQDKLADIMKVLAMPHGPLQRLEAALKSLKKG